MGVMLEIVGILALLPFIVALIYGDGFFVMFLLTAAVTFAIGAILDRNFEKTELDLGSAMIITALSFVVISLFGAIPYMFYLSPIDAVFESVSGFTTTGLSVISLPETMPVSLLFWRSFTQWIGGIGVLVIFLVLMGSSGISSYYLYKAEGGSEKLEASVKHSVRKMFKIFGLYTVIGVILLLFAGLPALDAILVTFSSVSTGGFAPHSLSIAFYNSSLVELIVIFLMICGATSFFMHDRLIGRARSRLKTFGQRVLVYSRNPETQLFWSIAAIFTILLFFAFSGVAVEPIRHAIFHSVSAITTTGFSTINLTGLQSPMFLIIILMVIGGYAGSTAGGIKLVRLGIIAKSFTWVSKKMSYPIEAVMPFKFGGKTIREHELSMVFLYVCLYVALLIFSGIVLMFIGYAPLDSFFMVSSAQGTVGFSTVDLVPMLWQGKIMLMINMLLGRLEIFPFLVLLYSLVNSGVKRDKL
jgi:trk system potassium uptake protein TrkH